MYRPPVSLSYALWSRKVPSTHKFQLLMMMIMMMIFWIEDRHVLLYLVDDMLGTNTYFYDNAHYKRRSIQTFYCPVGLSYAF
jgi:hypothetical protein